MLKPTDETVVEALRIVRTGGELGYTVAGFGSKWPGKMRKGQTRKHLGAVGRFLNYLATEGLVDRSVRGPRGRFTLTPAGESMLAEAQTARRRP